MQNRFDEHWDGIVRNRQTPLCEEHYRVIGEYYEIQNPTLESVIAYIKRAVRGHKTDKSDLEYAIDDLEKVGRALEAILKKAKAKGK